MLVVLLCMGVGDSAREGNLSIRSRVKISEIILYQPSGPFCRRRTMIRIPRQKLAWKQIMIQIQLFYLSMS